MYKRYRHAGSTEKVISLLGKKTQARKPQKRIVNWVTQSSPYHSLYIYPTPNKNTWNCPECIKKLKYKSGRWSKPGAQSADDQQAGGSGSPEPTTSVVWTPWIVSSSATTLSAVPPAIATSLELDAPAADSTTPSDAPPHQQARLSSQPPSHGAPSSVL